jgi:glycosyltransferase involved in cell wall biosynthesis
MSANKQLHVLFLSSWYPTRILPTNGDFVERHMHAVAEFCNVSVLHVCFDTNLTKKGLEISHKQVKNANVYIIYFSLPKVKIHLIIQFIKLLYYIKAYIKGYRLIKKNHGKIEIVHANILYPIGALALMFKVLFKLPYVLSEHWTGYIPERNIKISKFKLLLSRIITKNAKYVLLVSENLGFNMREKGFAGNYKVVPNVVDTKFFAPLLPRNFDDKKRIIHISSLKDEHKNISGILNVIAKLSLLRTDFELFIVGPPEKYAIEKARNLGLLNRFVFFRSELSYEKVAGELRNSTFLLMFSNYENLPCVIEESLACGIPVISTNVGGISEHINKQNGVLINKGDEQALLDATVFMLDHWMEYKQTELRDYAIAKFSYSVIGKQFTDIYNS